MRLRRPMRGRERKRKKLIFFCQNSYALSSALEISDRPEVTVRFKVVVINPTKIKKVFYQRPVVAMETGKAEDLNLVCHWRELLANPGHRLLTGWVGVSEDSYSAAMEFPNIIGEQFDAGTEAGH